MYQLSKGSRGGLTPSLSTTPQIGNYGNGLPIRLAFPKLKLREVHYEARIAMPSGRCLPSAFGIYVRRDGSARYAPVWTRPWRSTRLASMFSAYAFHVI